MDTAELQARIFTFDKKLAKSGDLTMINDKAFNLDGPLRKLRCMRGIDVEFIPRFKFF